MDPKKKLKKCAKNPLKNDLALKKKLKKILHCNDTNTLLNILDLPDDQGDNDYENDFHPSLEANVSHEIVQNQPADVKQPFKLKKTVKLKQKLKKCRLTSPTIGNIDSAVQHEETAFKESEMMNVISDIVSEPFQPDYFRVEMPESSAKVIQSSSNSNSSFGKQKKKKSSKQKLINKKNIAETAQIKVNSNEGKIKTSNILKTKRRKDETTKKTKNGEFSKTALASKIKQDNPFFHNEVQDNFCFGFSTSQSPLEEENIVPSYSDNSDDFDVNRSLAGKIITKIKNKKKSKLKIAGHKNIQIHEEIESSDSSTSCENILDKYPDYFTQKIEQNVDYVSSILEVFDKSSLNDSSAVVSIATLQDNDGNLSSPDLQLEDHSGFTDDIDMEKSHSDQSLYSSAKIIAKELPDAFEDVDSINFFVISNFCIAVLKANTKTYFCGKLKVTLLKGSVEVLGHKITEKQCELYSLYISSLLSLNTSSGKGNVVNLRLKLVGLGVSDSIIKDILDQVSADDSVVVLRPHNNIMTDFVRKHFTNCNVFSSGKLKISDDQTASKLLDCQFYNSFHPGMLAVNETWSNIVNDFTQIKTTGIPNSILICGGKNSGKSTFLRYLVNKTLKTGPVLVIDLDPGQPEFTVGGVVSATIVKEPLLGPNFTHLQQPHRCLCLGLLNVTDNEERYFACVKDLIDYYSTSKYTKMPWIINTMGFGGNLGMKLMANIMNIIRPKFVVELMSHHSRNNFDIQLNAENINTYQESRESISIDDKTQSPSVPLDYQYYRVPPFQLEYDGSKTSVNKNLEPKLERLLNMLAYFSRISTAKSLSILEMIPYVIPMAAVDLAMNNIIVDDSYVASILNGKIVALCTTNSTHEKKIYKLGNDPNICHGYGIIRGIDLIEKMLYILTPIEPSLLASVNMLVYAESLPECHLMSIHTLPPNTRIPYTTPIAEEVEHRYLMKTPKRKFNPFRLLEIKRRA